jgi:hypothetical protein
MTLQIVFLIPDLGGELSNAVVVCRCVDIRLHKEDVSKELWQRTLAA